MNYICKWESRYVIVACKCAKFDRIKRILYTTQFFLIVLMVIATHTAWHHNKSCVHLLWERVNHCCKKSDVENIGSLSGSLLIFFCFHPHNIARELHVSSVAKVAIHFTWSPKCFSDHIDGFCFVLYSFMLPLYTWVSGTKLW